MSIQLTLHEGVRRREKIFLIFVLPVQVRWPTMQALLLVTGSERAEQDGALIGPSWSNQHDFS